MPPDLSALLKAHRNAPVFSVYDGRERAGSVVEIEGEHLAFDAVDLPLGSFTGRRDAIAAIPVSNTVSSSPIVPVGTNASSGRR